MKKKVKEYLSHLGLLILCGSIMLLMVPKQENSMVTKVESQEGNREISFAVELVDPIVYDNLTLTELSLKLDRSLNSTVKGKGYLFASYSLKKGVDPYLAVAIMLHETGCKWKCSTLVSQCNNVGGQKGSPTCGSGSYARFSSLDEGIEKYIDNLANNYIAYGLVTPDAMQRRYTGYSNGNWASKVNGYIDSIKKA